MTRRIVITSGKGGVGKTTVCANVGIQLADMGYSVVMVDADIGLNNLDVIMGVENKVSYDVIDVLNGKCRISQALIEDVCYPSLQVLPSSHIRPSKFTAAEFSRVIDKIRTDFVLIDCPAGIDAGFHRAVASASEAYVVVTPSLSSVRDADKVLNLLNAYTLEKVGIIVNRIRGDLVSKGEMIRAGDIARLLNAPMTGIIPDDDKIGLSINLGFVKDKSSAGKAFRITAENLVFGRNRYFDYLEAERGLFAKLKRCVK